jgi:hypothetical protein
MLVLTLPSEFSFLGVGVAWCFELLKITFKILNLIQIELSLNDSKHFAKHISKVRVVVPILNMQ